jgi:hypothetical protein
MPYDSKYAKVLTQQDNTFNSKLKKFNFIKYLSYEMAETRKLGKITMR